eukprot:gene9032-biopygen1248
MRCGAVQCPAVHFSEEQSSLAGALRAVQWAGQGRAEQRSAVRCGAVHWSPVQCCAVQWECGAVRCSSKAVQCGVVQRSAVLSSAVLCVLV